MCSFCTKTKFGRGEDARLASLFESMRLNYIDSQATHFTSVGRFLFAYCRNP